jgi:hypothetical protein
MVLMSVVMTSVWGQSLVNFGFKGGIEVINMSFNADALKASNRAGFFVGPSLRFNLPIVGLGLDASVFYSQRDLKADGESTTQKSLLLPAHVRYGVGIGDVLSIFVTAGPQFSFNLGNDVFHWTDENGNDSHFTFQNTLLSADLGAGVTIGRHLEAAVYYNIPVGKTGDFTWERLGDKLGDETWNSAKSRTNAWRVSLAYYF